MLPQFLLVYLLQASWRFFSLQVCQVHLVVDESDLDGVNLIQGTPKIETSKELTEYYVTNDPKSPTLSQENNKEVSFNIIFKRRMTNEAVMTFFPSLLFITISYATSFFKLPNFFNTAITVNITLMLTTTTLLISVVKKLAQTSYVKWIEAWLIFAMLIPFVQVILITCIEWLREEKKQEDMYTNTKEKEQVRSNEPIWLDVANKLVKVGHPIWECQSFLLLFCVRMPCSGDPPGLWNKVGWRLLVQD